MADPVPPPAPNPLSFQSIADSLGANVSKNATKLNDYIEKMEENPTTEDMIGLQRYITEWSLVVELTSTMNKTVADTMKGVVQKSG